jgi:hypothetical protein
MKNYTTEDNIDFFSELYKSLDTVENQEKTEEDDSCCLITREKLTDRFVTMVCGHKFNYEPLFKDIMHHKLKFNKMESTNKLHLNQIRCPFCRNKQTEMLPYYEDMSFEKMNGVNFYSHYLPSSNYYRCNYKRLNSDYNSNEEESESNQKYILCFLSGNQFKYDNNYYCYKHTKCMISKYKQDIINNKEEEKKKKEEEKKKKEEEKKKKEEEKKKKMMEDKMNKIENKLNKLEDKIEKHSKEHAKYPLSIIKKKQHENKNVIISDITIEKELNETPETPNEKHDLQFTRCKHVLKTGINKGSTCRCKIFQDELCKRHYLEKN